MSKRTPVVRQISWLGTIPQLAAVTGMILVGNALWPPNGMFVGAAVYLGYSVGSRRLIPRAHRVGITLVKQRRYADAIPRFQESWDFFERYPWIDRYRSVILMSPSAMSYREMALCNMAFCYTQAGDGQHARDLYTKCLELFPENALASVTLRIMDSAAQTIPRSDMVGSMTLEQIARDEPDTQRAALALRKETSSPIQAIKALRDGRQCSPTTAKEAIFSSPAWAAEVEAAQAMYDELAELLGAKE